MQPILEMRGITKTFPGVKALDNVNLKVAEGEIHALCGENGAGKSTLMKVLSGIYPHGSYEGDIYFRGDECRFSGIRDSERLGIIIIHQELALIPLLSIAENIYLGNERAEKGIINWSDTFQRTEELLKRVGLKESPKELITNLGLGKQQLVEIAKALTLDCRILIFDEPTAALTERESDRLFEIIHSLAADGIGIIYISHRMAEIFEHCDRVTVMRDGRYIRTLAIAETSPEEVVASMVGRVLDSLYPDKLREDQRSSEAVLEVEGLSEARDFKDVSFRLMKGEILGFGGLIGAGRSEIVKGLCRLEGEVTGKVRLNGQPLSLTHYADSIAAGIVYLSEDRKGDGLFLDLPIAANISALAIERVSTGFGLVSERRERGQAEELGRRLALKCGDVGDPVSTLSGGNQQKVAIAKMLSIGPKVIILDEPTRGVDVGAKAEIHRILRELALSGVGILVISSELPELIGLCDRVLVVREGRIAGEVSGEDMTEENIMVLASLTDGHRRAA